MQDENKSKSRQQDKLTAGRQLRCDVSQAHTAYVFSTRTARRLKQNNMQICIQQSYEDFRGFKDLIEEVFHQRKERHRSSSGVEVPPPAASAGGGGEHPASQYQVRKWAHCCHIHLNLFGTMKTLGHPEWSFSRYEGVKVEMTAGPFSNLVWRSLGR